MKYLIFILLAGLQLKSFTQISCSPNLKEIYDFEVGDVFQYSSSTFDENTYNSSLHSHIGNRRSTVLEKMISADTIMYIMDNKTFSYYDDKDYPYGNYFLPSKKNYQDTLIIIDSSNHFLNACDSQIVKLDIDYYMRVLNYEKDGIKIKSIGKESRFYVYNSNDSLIEIIKGEGPYLHYERKYAAGLGLISQYEHRFEISESFDLVGTVIDGDTAGTVWKDSDFPVSMEDSPEEYNLKIYPTTLLDDNIINLSYEGVYHSINIFSINGESQQCEIINDKKIRLINSSSGIYFLIIDYNNFSVSQMIIKQ